jgi:anti-sigma factor RsiW
MSCREVERLFVADAAATEVAAHRRSCAECERLGREIDKTVALYEGLRAPAWSPVLRRALLEIPRQTVSCEGAERLLAEAVEGEIAGADDRRLQGHLSRCPACTEAAAVLFSVRDLEAPAPPAWLATRLAASRPEVKRGRRALLGQRSSPCAYALALVMLLGWNPTGCGPQVGSPSSVSTCNAVTVAQHSLSDRLGAVQDKGGAPSR